jgi:intraflagellar transport protein 88
VASADNKPASPLPEEQIKTLEKKVNALVNDSCMLADEKNLKAALDKAKEAGKRERLLAKQREQAGLGEQVNLDLTYCVLFNLANQYHSNQLHQEALNSYAVIVKNKMFNQSGRLRVNMGNIYFEQQKYSQAVKMYRMALDQIPNTNRDIRYSIYFLYKSFHSLLRTVVSNLSYRNVSLFFFPIPCNMLLFLGRLKIMRNIGNSFVKMGQFQDAITSYESIMETNPEYHTGWATSLI